jgi:hypothetical protein
LFTPQGDLNARVGLGLIGVAVGYRRRFGKK